MIIRESAVRRGRKNIKKPQNKSKTNFPFAIGTIRFGKSWRMQEKVTADAG